jgi:flagellar motor switch protein FliN/FliY
MPEPANANIEPSLNDPPAGAADEKGALRQAPKPPGPHAPVLPQTTPVDRLRDLPVPIIVKLAEKRIEVGQLLAIGPGAIITFEKSCEDLLDLYVNNRLYCRGEAVKIGEKFGIKICQVGSTEERISAVLAIN